MKETLEEKRRRLEAMSEDLARIRENRLSPLRKICPECRAEFEVENVNKRSTKRCPRCVIERRREQRRADNEKRRLRKLSREDENPVFVDPWRAALEEYCCDKTKMPSQAVWAVVGKEDARSRMPEDRRRLGTVMKFLGFKNTTIKWHGAMVRGYKLR